jgi:hypothetical protein
MRLEFHPAAADEIEAAVANGLRSGHKAGALLRGEVWQAIHLLLGTPDIGAPLSPRLRRFYLKHVPFALIYSHHGDALRVIALAHKRRKPGYWRSRQ